MIVLHWHGFKAGQDRRGALRPPPIGIDDLRAAKVTHVGVPMHHGEEDGYNYAKNLSESGFKIIRNIELAFNAGVGLAYPNGEINLGRIITEYKDAKHPGEFFERFVNAVRIPCDGLFWNLEHNAINQSLYPITKEDKALIGSSSLVDFRCFQFALIFKLYRVALEYALGGRQIMAIGYSGYPHLIHNNTTVQRAYCCDWKMQITNSWWRDEILRGIDYGVCAHCDFDIIPTSDTLLDKRILHLANPIQEQPLGKLDQASLAKYAVSRLHNIGNKFGVGLALVAAHMRLPWGIDDAKICQIVGEKIDLYLKDKKRKAKIIHV